MFEEKMTQPTNPWAVTSDTKNPYLAGFDSATDSALSGIPQVQKNIEGMQGQMNSQYPTYPNPYGIGSGSSQGDTGAVPGTASNPNYLTKPVSVTVPDSASRGFNPWSLTGESNARGQ